MEDNIYIKNLKKFIGQTVEVKSIDGYITKGKVLGFDFLNLNVILKGNSNNFIIRNWVSLKSENKGAGEK